jgi:hypothetical protein
MALNLICVNSPCKILSMQLLTPTHFTDYELLDCGDFEKLERFGKYILIRPEPQAVWPKVYSTTEWEKLAHIKFIPKSSSSGEWKKIKQMPDQWEISYVVKDLRDKRQDAGDKTQDEVGKTQETRDTTQETRHKTQETRDKKRETRFNI